MNTKPGVYRSWRGWIGPALAGTIMWTLLLALPVALEGQGANGCEEPACGIPYDSLVADTTALHREALRKHYRPVRCAPDLPLYQCRLKKMRVRMERIERSRQADGFELWKAPLDEDSGSADGPLAIFPDGGFYAPGVACREYAALLTRQDTEARSDNPHLRRLWQETAILSGGFYCRAR